MNEISTSNHSHPSPFDAIKQVREDGTEYWSARDIMPMLAYSQWKNFETPLNRAMTSAKAQGHGIEHHFSQSRKVSTSGPSMADYELSRFAAYLVAMNGDPNKPEVAAAQSYFAIRTREAEVRPFDQHIPKTLPEALVAYAQEIKAREAIESYARELEPKADAYDTFISGDGSYAIGTVAKMLGLTQNKLFDLLRNAGILIAKGHMRNTPYRQYQHHFRVSAFDFERSDGTRGTSYTTRVQPSGIEFIRRKLGLPKLVAA